MGSNLTVEMESRGVELPSAEADGAFAQYLAKYFIAQKGFREAVMPEAPRLSAACDTLLANTDGPILAILCIVDATRNPLRHFALDREAVIDAAKACRARYGGRMNGARMPVTVDIIEVRDQVLPRDIARLKPLRSRYKQVVASYAVDLSSRTVTANFWSLYNARRKQIETALLRPRLSAAALVPPVQAAVPDVSRRPVLTMAMLAVLAAIFALEVKFSQLTTGGALSMAPSLDTLVAAGGMVGNLVVERGEWFRLFTATLLHGNLEHIIFNGIAFWFAGSVLEKLLGRAWLLALFFLGGLGGSLMSLAINDRGIVSIGASGAIMAMIAAALVVAYRFPGRSRHQVQFQMLRMLIPSLLPLAVSSEGGGIDYAAHFGGAITGFLISGILLRLWPRTAPAPRFAPFAKIVAVLSLLVFAGSGYQAYAGHQAYALGAFLIPDNEMPHGDAEIVAKSKALVAAYPRDPRAHFFRAAALMDQDPPAAEHALRAALAQKDMLDLEFNPSFRITLISYLAQTLITQGRSDEARLEAKPYCHSGKDGAVPEDLAPLGICTGQ
jgi:rhomboid protease GluP